MKVPYLVRWPGKIKPGTVSDHLFYYPDVMPTLAELTSTKCPKNRWNLISAYSFIESEAIQSCTHVLELGQQRAVRKDNWKAYRDKKGNWELYDLSSDIEEKIDLAHKKEKTLKDLIALAESLSPTRPFGKNSQSGTG